MIEERLLRAVLYIEHHLGDALTVERLADEACISAFHFHRLFRLWAGEPVIEYVRRLRLEHGAYRLRATNRPIRSLAREVGYASADAFGRAFRDRFGESPRAYRDRWSGTSVGPLPANVRPSRVGSPKAEVASVRITPLPSWRMVCFRKTGPYQEAGRAWEALDAWRSAYSLPLAGAPRIGISHDDPELVPPRKRRYDAAYVVRESQRLAIEPHLRRPMYWRLMPAGDYAAVMHHGPYHELENAYRRLFLEWLPTSGRYPADAPVIERYLNSPREVGETELVTELLLPLR